MDPKSQKPLRLLVNPLTIWTDLALKTGKAMLASAQAAAARSNTPAKVAVIPPAEAPAPKASKAVRAKAPRAKSRRKARAKSRARR